MTMQGSFVIELLKERAVDPLSVKLVVDNAKSSLVVSRTTSRPPSRASSSSSSSSSSLQQRRELQQQQQQQEQLVPSTASPSSVSLLSPKATATSPSIVSTPMSSPVPTSHASRSSSSSSMMMGRTSSYRGISSPLHTSTTTTITSPTATSGTSPIMSISRQTVQTRLEKKVRERWGEIDYDGSQIVHRQNRHPRHMSHRNTVSDDSNIVYLRRGGGSGLSSSDDNPNHDWIPSSSWSSGDATIRRTNRAFPAAGSSPARSTRMGHRNSFVRSSGEMTKGISSTDNKFNNCPSAIPLCQPQRKSSLTEDIDLDDDNDGNSNDTFSDEQEEDYFGELNDAASLSEDEKDDSTNNKNNGHSSRSTVSSYSSCAVHMRRQMHQGTGDDDLLEQKFSSSDPCLSLTSISSPTVPPRMPVRRGSITEEDLVLVLGDDKYDGEDELESIDKADMEYLTDEKNEEENEGEKGDHDTRKEQHYVQNIPQTNAISSAPVQPQGQNGVGLTTMTVNKSFKKMTTQQKEIHDNGGTGTAIIGDWDGTTDQSVGKENVVSLISTTLVGEDEQEDNETTLPSRHSSSIDSSNGNDLSDIAQKVLHIVLSPTSSESEENPQEEHTDAPSNHLNVGRNASITLLPMPPLSS